VADTLNEDPMTAAKALSTRRRLFAMAGQELSRAVLRVIGQGFANEG
jgi:hypothetical protein